MAPSSNKRLRRDYGGSYRDPIPVDENYSLIHVREGRLHQSGNHGREFRTVDVDRVTVHPSGPWDSTTSWAPPDDPEYALDEDGAWYDEALERPVMDELAAGVEDVLATKCCATFELLTHLQHLVFTTKASTYDIYRALEKRTNNTGMSMPKSRYRALSRMILQWRHLKMLKWAGRGHDPSGAAGTQPGELAIRCPSCPIDGINLPTGWRQAPPEFQFLYMAIICMDANFRLKNQIVSNYSQDPGLGPGWAYMLPREPYESYVLSRADNDDISTCVGFQALAKANTKFSRGLRYTGVGLTVCGRSEMIMPSGVGNLHKGERYANMDYIFASALQNIILPLVKLIPAIPKLHEPAHQAKNHEMYSLNYLPGAGLSDCECPERVWAPHNPLANSTKTQGPGSRQDVLDTHFGFWNWLKYVGLGDTLLRRYKAAVAERNIQVEAHRGLTRTWEEKSAAWEKMCRKWDDDTFPKKSKSPYKSKGTSMSEAEVKKKLENEENERLRAGGTSVHSTSPWVFVCMGLDLEDAQRRLRREIRKKAQDRPDDNITEQRRILRSRIQDWELIQPIFMPGILQYRADTNSSARAANPTIATLRAVSTVTDHPEDTEIWLPSRVSAPHRDRVCVQGLAGMEEQLRDAQLQDALEGVRLVLRMKSRMVQFKNANIRGQRDGTISRAMIDRVHERARVCVEKYRVARLAKIALAGPGQWQEKFRVMEDGDVRGYQDPTRLRQRQGRPGTLEDSQLDGQQAQAEDSSGLESDSQFLLAQERERRDGTGETRRTVSWIWRVGDQGMEGEADEEIARTEWARSRARSLRAKEEVMLLKEEMRRVLDFLAWKEKWWTSRQTVAPGVPKDQEEGLVGYAAYQASVQRALRDHFLKMWETPLTEISVAGVLDPCDSDDGLESEAEEEEGEEEESVEQVNTDDDALMSDIAEDEFL
ncbi:hypothetical protein CPC08DRAFT_646182 [Agrocybe pediades]|nr:hypothetical protein CPC08DRAFT_646182 [Agrocybe pediades]